MTKINRENAFVMLDELENSKIDNSSLRIGIMCVIAKESGFGLHREKGYRNTSVARIREIFPTAMKGLSDAEIRSFSAHERGFFNHVYSGKIGNRRGTDDGYNFRGAGWPQITGRANFKKYCPEGIALDALPWFLENSPIYAAKTAINFFTAGLKWSTVLRVRYGKLDSSAAGIRWAANIAAGVGRGKNSAAVKRAVENAEKHLDEVIEIYNDWWIERIKRGAENE